MRQRRARFSTCKSSRTARLALAGIAVAVCICGCRKSTEPEETWGSTGVGPGQFVYPRGIAYSPKEDAIWVVDRTAHVQKLDRHGKPVIGANGQPIAWRMPDFELGKPVGLTVGPDGNLYVPDTHYSRVIVYSPTGEELRRWGRQGHGDGEFIWPTDIVFDDAGNLYISEYGDNDRIQVFTPDGTFVRKFGSQGEGPGQFYRPQSMVILHDLLYVTDVSNHRIQVLRLDGTFVKAIGSVGSGPGQLRFPYGLDADRNGRLVVSEFGNSRVQLLDPQTGKSLGIWGAPGTEAGQLLYPWSLAVDKEGRIITVDSGNNRLVVFEF